MIPQLQQLKTVVPVNKKELLDRMENMNNPHLNGKALGLTLGTTIAGGTIGALTGEIMGNPVLGGLSGLGVGAGLGTLNAQKYFIKGK